MNGASLASIRVVEIGGIGPVPFAGMYFRDHGADVDRVVRPGETLHRSASHTHRGKNIIPIDLRTDTGLAQAQDLIKSADVLLEGFRPGVMERLGLSPESCLELNPRLVFGRMTGWGQYGPLSTTAGHDINYLAITGALHAIGSREPTPPLNLLGDYGGGAMFLVSGVLSALVQRGQTGRGQIIDAAIVDGVSYLLQIVREFLNAQEWEDERASNLIDGGAPFYSTYRCSDGREIAVGAIESAFYSNLVETLGLNELDLPSRHDRNNWPHLRRIFADTFAAHSREEWTRQFDGVEACVSPVLSLRESVHDAHLVAREVFLEEGRVGSPVRVAPRLTN